MDLSNLTIANVRDSLDRKEYSAREIAESFLAAARAKNPDVHAYLELFEKTALEDADRADTMIAEGKAHALTGIPIAIKDNILIEGQIASAGSKILESYRASYDATVTKRLKEEGAALLGRTNMDEFALGSSTENSAYGPSKNPHDVSRVPGGTSGGSAAAVAGGIALGALGSDTGGSLRQPASFCGVVGLKPTYGAVSRFGLIAAASSLDQIGTISKTVEDAGILFSAIRGNDPKDSTSLPAYEPRGLSTKKIGVPRSFLAEGVDPDVLENFDRILAGLKGQYEIVDIELPALSYSLAVYYIINPAEVSSNLARFDGIRYGFTRAAETISEVYTKSRGEGFGMEARRRILLGTFVLSSGYVDAYYRKATAVRELIRHELGEAFKRVDAIATPTAPTPAFKIGEKSDPLAMYAGDIFTTPVNLSGVPAISVPSGFVHRDGARLPVGFQIIAAHQHENVLFDIGSSVERLNLA